VAVSDRSVGACQVPCCGARYARDGGTDKPLAAEEYSTKKLCVDLAALLDIFGVSRAVSLRIGSDIFTVQVLYVGLGVHTVP
jgi:hypothetical protein